MVQNFITLLRTHNLKFRNCLFLEFSIQYFWAKVHDGLLRAWKVGLQIKRELLYLILGQWEEAGGTEMSPLQTMCLI